MRPGGGRAKGSSFERLIAKKFSRWCGHKVDRTPLSGGWGNSKEHQTTGDLVVEKKYARLFPFTVECKKHEGWCLDDLIHCPKTKLLSWWRQVKRDCAKKKIPLLVFARNRSPALAMIKRQDYSTLWTPLSNAFTVYLEQVEDEVIIMPLDALLASWPAPQRKKIKVITKPTTKKRAA